MHMKRQKTGLSRRGFIAAGGSTLLAMQILPGGRVIGEAWAQVPRALQSQAYATLVQLSRDLYPHDRLADRYYAAAVDVLDEAARADAEERALIEEGIGILNRAAGDLHGLPYRDVAWEKDRVGIIEQMIGTPFMQKVRANLVTGLYNNKELWPLFGYEGESVAFGGYIDRGFDDIDWV